MREVKWPECEADCSGVFHLVPGTNWGHFFEVEKENSSLAAFKSQIGPVSSVGIATAYGLDGPGIESRWGEIFRTSPDRP